MYLTAINSINKNQQFTNTNFKAKKIPTKGVAPEKVLDTMALMSVPLTAIGITASVQNNKTQNLKDVNAKMNELAILLGKAQNSSALHDIKLEIDPLVKEKVEEFYKNNGKYPTVDDIKDSFDENAFNRIGDLINKWKNDIIDYTKLENDLDQGDSLDEINFWIKSEVIYRSIKSQLESPEIQLTLDLAKNARKIFAINSFEDEIN